MPDPRSPDSRGNVRADLSGSVGLVTGASRGVGAHIASTLAAAGAGVALIGRDEKDLVRVEEEILERGGRAARFPHDLLRSEELGALFDRIEAALGPVDLLVNNAAASVTGRALEAEGGDFDRLFQTNVKAPFELSCEAARRWIERKVPGSVINIASINGEQPRVGLSLYCMSKASLIMMTKVLAREWARFDINVNAILPGAMLTDMTRHLFEAEAGRKEIAGFRRRRLMVPEELDGALLLLASRQAHAITGATIVVDDGQLP
jgi:NAD(P)-dependent dehydrogenase (short-subunit alcohol dehydrogenase family)